MPSIGGSQGGSPSGSSNGGNVGPGISGSIGNFALTANTVGELGITGMGLVGGLGNSASASSGTPANSFYGGWESATSQANQDSAQSQGMGYSASTGAMYGSGLGGFFGPIGMGLGGLFGAASSLAQGGPVPSGGGGPGGLGGPGEMYGVPTHLRPPGPPGAQPFQINPMQVQNDMRGGWGQGMWGGQQQPRMNPFSMYGTGQSANRGYNPFSMYGGK